MTLWRPAADHALGHRALLSQLRQAILRSLIYPSIVLLVLLLSSLYWLLVVIPAVPLLLAALLAWRAHRLEKSPPFAALRQQMAQDLATLRILDEE